MQVVVKTPHIKINIEGEIPQNLINLLKEDYADEVRIIDDPDEELVDITETEWYKNISAKMIPGDSMRIYRENAGMTQADLGKKLGDISRHKVSDMERGVRNISLKTAKKLAKIFNKSVDRFV